MLKKYDGFDLLKKINNTTYNKSGKGYFNPIIQLMIIATVLNVFLEVSIRHSIFGTIDYIVTRPYIFLYNTLIILITLSLSLLFIRRHFFLILISTIWIAFGIANFVLLSYRTIPLSASDFYILKSVFGIIDIYLNTIQIMMILGILIMSIMGLVMAWNKLPKNRVPYYKTFICVSSTLILIFSVSEISSARVFRNLVDAYNEYGFAYCFSTSLIDRGIGRPENYSEENIDEIVSVLNIEDSNTPQRRPNIVMVQLESFFDVNHIKGLELSENPVPYFTQLKEDFPSGFLKVPSIGAGTANTEFEVLTGMNLSYFGLGEYPYKTILTSSTAETIAYNLSELGYKSHAIHNNTATFYNRHTVFPNLGFDTFIPIEYMSNVEYSPIGWAKDDILTTEIIKAMESTDTKDFVYAISVQAHGKYPRVEVDSNQKIKVTGSKNDIEVIPYEYFINQIYEVDQFLGNLTEELSHYDEPVVVVIFGDHLPSLSITDDDLVNGDLFETEYVIWSNFPIESINQDLTTYQLSAYVLELLGINNGTLTKLHQAYNNEEDYEDKLLMLQYDMLYGNQYVFNGINPYEIIDMQMGVTDIKIRNARQEKDNIRISGVGFTPWSVVYINNRPKQTRFIDESTLMVENEFLGYGSNVFVAQVSDDRRVMSQTPNWYNDY
ncbi:phosphoglycerol transferase MdoB-like AlkP superfamily enzyme [Natranaerovirga pectinivora]|uniref:Phosphoglycerol transferase MdoB-like AlkP superfamily enzyme n=1 Tax=Natranaerovirga pectinivora TaxID=682400 RepID=A0A4R3MLI5_9FIRM|nr:LTA synthase family protein [Natranaerovirga pectinivora]TCT14876.1 phosphoglycerol transferase MdoB-like AlkP superfamily enzyme [Natranaerovirga pectinivora]